MGNEESKRGSERSSYRRGGRKDADYDEEAHKLFRLLNLDAGAGTTSRWNNLDVIYQHPTSGGKVYVGNISAAGSLEELTRHGVRRVVNCQDPSSENFHENVKGFKYYRFPIAHWLMIARRGFSTADCLKFFAGVWKFIDDSIAAGENVMIHCLAGAHRAGSTGIAYLMHAAGLGFMDATAAAKRLRPIIDPIASLGELLQILDVALQEQRAARGKAKAATKAASAKASASGSLRDRSRDRTESKKK